MKALKWLGGIVGIYALFVVIFEAGYLGYAQPSFEDSGIPMLSLTTTAPSGESQSTMLASIIVDEKIYVSAHHWSRGWHSNALENPEVLVNIKGVRSTRKAVPVKGLEFQNVAQAFPLTFTVRFLMGFPLAERQILRLDEV